MEEYGLPEGKEEDADCHCLGMANLEHIKELNLTNIEESRVI